MKRSRILIPTILTVPTVVTRFLRPALIHFPKADNIHIWYPSSSLGRITSPDSVLLHVHQDTVRVFSPLYILSLDIIRRLETIPRKSE